MQGETHDSDPAMSKLEHVIGRLGSSKPVGYPDPGNMWREAIELGWAGLVDDHQRQPAYGCHFEDRIIVGQRGGDEAVNHSATDGRSPLLIGRGTRQEEQPNTCRLDDARDTGKDCPQGCPRRLECQWSRCGRDGLSGRWTLGGNPRLASGVLDQRAGGFAACGRYPAPGAAVNARRQRRQSRSCRSISAGCRGDGTHRGCVAGRGSRPADGRRIAGRRLAWWPGPYLSPTSVGLATLLCLRPRSRRPTCEPAPLSHS